MGTLEKILEEIDAHSIEFEMFGVSDDYISVGWVKEIIRKHMNDGWIPVEERLPKSEQEHVLACRRDGSIDTARYSPYSDRWYVGSMCSVSLDVIAWRSLPEPYRPERSEGE